MPESSRAACHLGTCSPPCSHVVSRGQPAVVGRPLPRGTVDGVHGDHTLPTAQLVLHGLLCTRARRRGVFSPALKLSEREMFLCGNPASPLLTSCGGCEPVGILDIRLAAHPAFRLVGCSECPGLILKCDPGSHGSDSTWSVAACWLRVPGQTLHF